MDILRSTGRFIYGKLLPRWPYRVLKGPLKGARFVLGSLSGAGGGASVYFNQVEAEQSAVFCNVIKPGDTFFDVGANVGYYTILGSRSVGETGVVAAFEPLLRNLAILKRHVDLNDAHNVRIFPFAISDTAGIASFIPGHDNAMGKLGGSKADGGVLVPTVSLDEISDRADLRPHVIKIDVEGAEMEVLSGGARTIDRYKPAIFLSTHSDALRESCLAWLAEAGYSVEPLTNSDDPHEFLARQASV